MKFNSAASLAVYLKVHYSTISRWHNQGLPREEAVGFEITYDLETVLNWLEKKSKRHANFVAKVRAR